MRRSVLCLILVALAMLTGCAGGKKAEVAPAAPLAAEVEAPRDSLRAKFLLTLTDEEGKPQELDAVLFSVPGKRYRMELTGPLGIGVASMLWTEEGWTITFPTEKLYMRGNGYMVGLFNDNTIPLLHIHQVAGYFDGNVLPENFDLLPTPDSVTVAEGEQVFFAREKTGRNFSFAKKDSKVVWLSRTGRDGKPEVLRFKDYKPFEGVETPSNIVFERDGANYLEIRIKKVTRKKPFSMGTWRLNVPKSFAPVGG